MLLKVSFTILEASFMMLIVQVSLTIVIYDCKIFLVQAIVLPAQDAEDSCLNGHCKNNVVS
jgi:hypothetical protein